MHPRRRRRLRGGAPELQRHLVWRAQACNLTGRPLGIQNQAQRLRRRCSAGTYAGGFSRRPHWLTTARITYSTVRDLARRVAHTSSFPTEAGAQVSILRPGFRRRHNLPAGCPIHRVFVSSDEGAFAPLANRSSTPSPKISPAARSSAHRLDDLHPAMPCRHHNVGIGSRPANAAEI